MFAAGALLLSNVQHTRVSSRNSSGQSREPSHGLRVWRGFDHLAQFQIARNCAQLDVGERFPNCAVLLYVIRNLPSL